MKRSWLACALAWALVATPTLSWAQGGDAPAEEGAGEDGGESPGPPAAADEEEGDAPEQPSQPEGGEASEPDEAPEDAAGDVSGDAGAEEGGDAEPEQLEQPEQPEQPTQPALTQEELDARRLDAAMGITAQRELEQQRLAQQKQRDEEVDYFLVAAPDDAPQLDYDAAIVCAYRPGSRVVVHLQCDHDAKRCLVAEDAVFRFKQVDLDGDGELEERAVPTQIDPGQTAGCMRMLNEEEYELLLAQGYELVPALLEIPHGYRRDERGRAFQTHFDLRSRMFLGVYYAGNLREDYTGSLTLETGSTYEHFSRSEKRRHRFKFIEGSLTLAPLEAHATLFDYNFGRVGDEPIFYITDLIGEPSRHDVYINIGSGLTLGRLDYRTYEGAQDQAFLDLVEGRLQWEVLQSFDLEDYIMFKLGGGMGTRRMGNEDAGSVYFYPEAAFEAMWMLSPRGLFQMGVEGRARLGYEPDTDASWVSATAAANIEWVALAISDQPLSLFVQPEARYLSMPGDDLEVGDVRVMAGVRLSLFTPPPTDPALIRRVLDGEDLGDY